MSGLLVAGGLADRSGGHRPTPAGTSALAALAAAPPAGALSSSWFCAGATDRPGGPAPATVVISDDRRVPVDGTVTVVGSQGRRVTIPVHVGADSRVEVPEAVPGGAPWIGAIVDLSGGGTSVEQQVTGALGSSVTPCATTGSNSWYFPDGATLVNASAELTLLDPYPSAAIVDLSFASDQGVEQPGGFQGLVVPANGLLAVDLGTHLRRRQHIATTVSVRSGRVAAWQTDVVTPPGAGQPLLGSTEARAGADAAAPTPGVTVVAGAPATATSWTWPEGDNGNGLSERYVVYNPGPLTAQVRLGVGLDAGRADPLDLTVGPDSVATVVSSGEARIPSGVGHDAVLQSTNGVGVVAERTLGGAPPSPVSGLGVEMGATSAVRDWLLGGGQADAAHQEYVVVYNPTERPARFSVDRLDGTSLPGLSAVAVGPTRRTAVLVNTHGGAGVGGLVVRASAPVVVERDVYGLAGSAGVGLSLGVPLAPG